MFYYYTLADETNFNGPAIILADYVVDNGLAALVSDVDRIYLCTDVPTSYDDATTTMSMPFC
jgi:hypothetical protein